MVTVTEPDVLFETDSTNVIRCKVHRSNWCSHIELLITQNQDAPELWLKLSQLNETELITVPIPYVPNLIGFIPVKIAHGSPQFGCTVLIVRPDDGAPEFIGTLFPGEGRNVIRQMIHNWFLPKLRNPETGDRLILLCKASSHKPRQEVISTRNLAGALAFGERWLLYWRGMCSPCNEMIEDMSDLVPDSRSK